MPELAFLTYCSRSGSTKLATMIDTSGADIIVVPEFRSSMLAFRFGADHRLSHQELAKLTRSDAQLRTSLRLEEPAIDRVIAASVAAPPSSYVRNVVHEYLAGDQAKVVLVKSGQMIHHAKSAIDQDASIRCIFLVRDPRAVVRSLLTTKIPGHPLGATFGLGSPFYSARLWRERLRGYVTASTAHPTQVRLVRYEALDEPSTVDDVLQFLGVDGTERVDRRTGFNVADNEAAIHQRVDRPFDPLVNEQWRVELAPRTVRWIESMLFHEMRALDYPSTGDVPGIARRIEVGLMATLYRPRELADRLIRQALLRLAPERF
ncbi:MAG: sulfotransferase [Acidimicrobiales bacterium]